VKQFAGLARVSSREQEREGFSLAVQEDALHRYAEREGGELVKLFKIAETASKSDERKTFRELIAYAKKHAAELSGILFYKVDRAARNLFDYVELERLESDFDVPFISVSQPTENTPAGRMMRRTLANMASFFTEQQSLDVREGLARRVQEGWFIGLAPYGYRNIRVEGRGLVEIDADNSPKVRRIFEAYAYQNLTLDDLAERLYNEGVYYLPTQPKFSTATLYYILTNRSYIGEIKHKGQWYPGRHEPLVDRVLWDRVQVLLGGHVYRCHEMTYGGELIECGHCGHPLSGEKKIKLTRKGKREYIYYRCSRYNAPDHPRIRVKEAELDQQLLALFDRMRIEDEEVRDWFVKVLRARTRDDQERSRQQRMELEGQLSKVIAQQDRLLNLRLLEEIEADTFAAKQTELRDRAAKLKVQIDATDRSHDENADIAVKAFELSQSLRTKWVTADSSAKRRILEIICLNLRLDDVSLCPTMRKPFDVLAEGLLSKESRGDWI
jgi:DNA invertase Pin-like site-specific DNA recombinase